MRRCLVAVLVAVSSLVPSGLAAEQDARQIKQFDFARTVAQPLPNDQWRWTLQTSVRTLRHPQTRKTITLLSMHHFGRREYYRSLELHLRRADLVLSEGRRRPTGKELPERFRWFGRWAEVHVPLLEVVRQKTWESEIRTDRWRDLDVPVDAQDAFCEEHGGTFPEKLREWVEKTEKWLDAGPPQEEILLVRDNAYKILFSRKYLEPHADDPWRLLNQERDRVIMKGLKEFVAAGKHDSIVMIYGARHTAALEPRIVAELGYRLESTCWHDALSYVPSPEPKKGEKQPEPQKKRG